MKKIVAAYVYDNENTKEKLGRLIGEDENLILAGEASTEEQMLTIVREKSPDLLLFPGFSGKLPPERGMRNIARIFQPVSYSLPGSEILLDDQEMEIIVTRYLLEIGMPVNVKGYMFIRDAVLLSLKDDSMRTSITKRLYPAIAMKYQTTSSRVERAIRHAIEVSFARKKMDSLYRFFGYADGEWIRKPTNSEFIAMVSDKIRMDYKKQTQKNRRS